MSQNDERGLRSVVCLETLRNVYDDDMIVDRLVGLFPTWQAVSSASPEGLSAAVQHNMLDVVIPSVPLPVSGLPNNTYVFTRYQINYPAGLRSLRYPPVIVYVRGKLPVDRTVAVVGAERPSPVGIEVARDTGAAAAAAGYVTLARLDTPLGRAAAESALRAGGVVTGVAVCGFNVSSTHSLLENEVLESGGSVIYPNKPDAKVNSKNVNVANATLVGLADAVVVAEAGLHVTAGREVVCEAVSSGKFLVVPRVDAGALDGRDLPDTMVGCAVLTEPGSFVAEYFGTNNKIENRVRAGKSAADAVVITTADLAAALAAVS